LAVVMSSWDNRWINEWPEGVGRAATEAVAYSSITILTSIN